MNANKAITVRLDPSDYEQLEVEANRIGVAPATLARIYVRAGLNGGAESETERTRRIGIDVLKKFAALRARLPDTVSPVDVVEIINAGREERARSLDI